ncbi:MAG: multidrug efflux SMR transporter [Candidatus Kapabacteria bacterium]|jgi:quaternary ammonium compound-resistance protein SugE|nr:multidrug efflux SMR transporter [Candidatus Kapabacteria bacterium]
MSWLYLFVAGLFEIGMTYTLKRSSMEGSGWQWQAAFVVCAIISFGALERSLVGIPLGTAYAVWTGIGAVGTVLVGMFVFNEPRDAWRLFFIATLLASIVGLKVTSK